MKKFIMMVLVFLAFGCLDIPELNEELIEFEKTYTSLDDCQDACHEQNFMIGECKWPSKADRSHLDIGSCVAEESSACSQPGKCNCYCYNITSYEEYAVD